MKKILLLLIFISALCHAKTEHFLYELKRAIADDNVEQLEELLNNKEFDLNSDDKVIGKILPYAVDRKAKKVVRRLIEKGIDVNTKRQYGLPVIYSVVENGWHDIAEMFIARGATIEAAENEKYASFFYHIMKYGENKPEMYRFVFRHGANVNYETTKHEAIGIYEKKQQTNILMSALRENHYDLAIFLVENGANPNAKDSYTPAIVSAIGSYATDEKRRLIKLMVEKGADVNAKNAYGVTALMEAASTDLELAQYLIDQGANLHAVDKDQNTVLHYASRRDYELVELFVEQGLDINAQNSKGETPLIEASNVGRKESVSYLLKKGANVNAVDQHGTSALHHAISSNSLEKTFFLLTHGANINQYSSYDGSGFYRSRKGTPLSLAFSRNSLIFLTVLAASLVHYFLWLMAFSGVLWFIIKRHNDAKAQREAAGKYHKVSFTCDVFFNRSSWRKEEQENLLADLKTHGLAVEGVWEGDAASPWGFSIYYKNVVIFKQSCAKVEINYRQMPASQQKVFMAALAKHEYYPQNTLTAAVLCCAIYLVVYICGISQLFESYALGETIIPWLFVIFGFALVLLPAYAMQHRKNIPIWLFRIFYYPGMLMMFPSSFLTLPLLFQQQRSIYSEKLEEAKSG